MDDEAAIDEAADTVLLSILSDDFVTHSVGLNADFDFSIIVENERRLVDDGRGNFYTITKNADNSLTVSARAISSEVTNEATSAASALYGATGQSYGGIVATNKVSATARAYIAAADYMSTDGTKWLEPGDRVELASGDVYEYLGSEGTIDLTEGTQQYATNTASWSGIAVSPTTIANNIAADGGVVVSANDSTSIIAVNTMKALSRTTNDGGFNILANFAEVLVNEYQFSTKSGTQSIVAGDMVRIASDYDSPNFSKGTSGDVYRYMGAQADVDLGTVDYDSDGDWVLQDAVDFQAIVPSFINLNVSGSDSISVGGLIILNDVRGEALGFIDDADVDVATGGVTVTATESVTIEARNKSVASADGGSFFTGKGISVAVAATIATNRMLSEANAYISDSTLGDSSMPIGGNVTVDAQNISNVNARTDSETTVEGAGTSIGVGVTLAYNNLGIKSEILSTVDALLGTNFAAAEQPAEVSLSPRTQTSTRAATSASRRPWTPASTRRLRTRRLLPRSASAATRRSASAAFSH